MRFDLTSKEIPLTAPRSLIAKLFGQQPVFLWQWIHTITPILHHSNWGEAPNFLLLQVNV